MVQEPTMSPLPAEECFLAGLARHCVNPRCQPLAFSSPRIYFGFEPRPPAQAADRRRKARTVSPAPL